MKLSEFITSLLPKSAQTRDLSLKKLDNNQVISGVYFLTEAANNGDIPALMALSTLLLKESNNCAQTKAAAAKYAERALMLDPNNALARKILLALGKKEKSAFSKPSEDSETNLLVSQQASNSVVGQASKVLSLKQKEDKILGINFKKSTYR